jgi:DNA-binding winged helix-turn-helix (wHTH) protein
MTARLEALLRRMLRTAGVEPIETVRGIGYRYRPQRVEMAPSTAEPERRRL